MQPAQVTLRPTNPRDIPVLFRQQSDPASNVMAGTKPRTEEVFRATWDKIFTDAKVIPRVILDGDTVAGAINLFQRDGKDYVGYWIDRAHWNRGVASQALALFITEVSTRPIHASAQATNAASIHILRKCGFRETHRGVEEATERFVHGEVAHFVLD
jgi:RimJ/RimL family protein N-acetyltransferase